MVGLVLFSAIFLAKQLLSSILSRKYPTMHSRDIEATIDSPYQADPPPVSKQFSSSSGPRMVRSHLSILRRPFSLSGPAVKRTRIVLIEKTVSNDVVVYGIAQYLAKKIR